MKRWKGGPAVWLALMITVFLVGCGGTEQVEESGISSAVIAEQESAVSSTATVEMESSIENEPIVETDSDTADSTESATSAESTTGAETATETGSADASEVVTEQAELLDPDGTYTSCEDVALYLETYEKLPGNFITKKEAQALGWEGGSLEPYAPGKCIGGDKFGNYEGTLPEKKGRVYRECDIDTLGKKSRGAKRIVYSSDGLIYYTEDHYETFTLLYD